MQGLRTSATSSRLCRAIVAIAAAFVILAVPQAWAAPSATGSAEQVHVRLMSAVHGTGDLANVPAGLEVKLDGDWKTYWRSPGDAGLPPTLDWQGSGNLASATLLYPAPTRITVLGIQTFGYKHRIVFPIDVKPKQPGKPLDLKLKLDLLICAEQCIPKSFDLALTIPAGEATPTDDAQTIAQARSAVPADARAAGFSIAKIEEVSDKGAPALEVTAKSERPFEKPDIIPELKPDAQFGTPRVKLGLDKREATFVLPLSRKLPVGAKLTGRDAILTLTDEGRALEAKGKVAQGASATEVEPGPSIWSMLAVALLGGLILNLMPCVLPVLSLKFMSVVGQGGKAPSSVRAGFLASAAGIIVSFVVIAGALIGLKAAGQTIGWGIQFQEPAFIAAMAVLVTIFACHLVGLFEVPLPRFIRDAASARGGKDESLAGHFVTGAFATLLATPCSAPFLGTAVGFALAGGALDMLAIFLALGIGLALPYLAVAAVPQLATKMPKPGKWMETLKKVLALPLAATALWMVTILAAQVGMTAALVTSGLLLAIVALIVVRGHLPEERRGVLFPAVVVASLAAIVLPDVIAAQVGKRDAEANGAVAWKSFDRDKIRGLLSQGKIVFVDVTADWCLTCKANKRFVLSKDEIAQRLNKEAISMQADWTRPNPDISAYLASYGRYGIPFNIVYGPGAPGGIVLPELLTTGDVAGALDKASKSKSSAAQTAPSSPAMATAKPTPKQGSTP